MHHMTVKKYLRTLETEGSLDVIEGSELFDMLIAMGFYNEHAYTLGEGTDAMRAWRFYFTAPDYATRN